MTTAGAESRGPRSTGALRALRRRPQLVAEIVAVAAWALLVAHAVGALAGVHRHSTSSAVDAVAGWTVMAAAMMIPSAIPAARHVGVNSLRWRRHRAVGEYVAAYLAVWVAWGGVALAVAARWRPSLYLVLAVAAGWQVTPWKRRFMRDCHRTVPLPATGLRAAVAALRFGARNARACVGSCWALMLVMVVVPSAQLAWMALLAAVVGAEKLLTRPARTAHLAGAVLVVSALATLLTGPRIGAVVVPPLLLLVPLSVLDAPQKRGRRVPLPLPA